MIKILDQEMLYSTNEYFVFHFYQMKPTIKYYLV